MCDAGVENEGECVCEILRPKLYVYISNFIDVFFVLVCTVWHIGLFVLLVTSSCYMILLQSNDEGELNL